MRCRDTCSFDAHAMEHIPDEDMPAVTNASLAVVHEAIDAALRVFGGGKPEGEHCGVPAPMTGRGGNKGNAPADPGETAPTRWGADPAALAAVVGAGQQPRREQQDAEHRSGPDTEVGPVEAARAAARDRGLGWTGCPFTSSSFAFAAQFALAASIAALGTTRLTRGCPFDVEQLRLRRPVRARRVDRGVGNEPG